MIRYTLICDQDHRFDSWFQSSAAYSTLEKAGHLACAVCGSGDVKRALMAPSVPAKGNTKDEAPQKAVASADPAPLSAPMSDAEAAFTRMRKEVEEKSDYVGLSFASEARKMHEGDAPERPIYGEAKLDEAKKLIEDGIPVAPLPFMPKRKTN
ncbi:DUF1178 family protein [Pseudooctadecabacter jejudonensis]|uniref:Uncharacterized protein n=1 Tax=Pseudooctadecabacter jejudonensis TaxID=1391910 RepID=A0A1Y5SW18_9RHOB|nr:DUF1178 family protein [Pseudooctadecabacter jejudonensis]SLN49078.1 hypothetical protein PSJ8397_02531 [Pseudooctadecabacter jejudonensis]